MRKPAIRFFRSRFGLDRRGSVSVIASYFFIILTSATALTIQGADMYVTKLQGQRTADLASQAAASTTNPIVNGSPSAIAAATALNIATINGFGTSTIATTVANSGTTINTTITTTASVFFSQIYNAITSTSVFNTSTAKPVTPLTSGCVAALTGEAKVFNSGSIVGSSCDVMAATDLSVSASTVNVAGIAVGVTSSQEASNLTNPTSLAPTAANFMYRATLTDPMASNASVTAIKAHLAAMATWPYATTSPVTVSAPSVSASANNLSFSSGNQTIANGHYGTLTIGNVSSLTFSGSGAADPSCTNPTTFSGATNLINTVNFNATFNSGCYIFKGDFSNLQSMSMYGLAAANANLTFIFEGSINNYNEGGIQFPAGTFSIAGNLNNSGGNWITLGNGSKVIGGNISNYWSTLNLSNGPFYLLGSSISNQYGAVTFGTGPTYVFNSTVTSGTNGSSWSQGSMSFGGGPYYFYNSTLNSGQLNGANAPTLTFASGNAYFYNSAINLNSFSTTRFGSGNMDLYNTSLTASGSALTLGYGGTAATGTMMISQNGGSLVYTQGSLTARGVTIATTGNDMYVFPSSLDIEAPTAAIPSYGAQNIAFINTGGNINFGQNSGNTNVIGGVIYAPGNTINLYMSQTFNPPSGGCLQAVAGAINIFNSARINPSPCTGLAVSATGGVPLLQ